MERQGLTRKAKNFFLSLYFFWAVLFCRVRLSVTRLFFFSRPFNTEESPSSSYFVNGLVIDLDNPWDCPSPEGSCSSSSCFPSSSSSPDSLSSSASSSSVPDVPSSSSPSCSFTSLLGLLLGLRAKVSVDALAELIDGRERLEELLVLVSTATWPLTEAAPSRSTLLTTMEPVEVEATAEGRVRRLLRGEEGLAGGDIVMAWLERRGAGEDNEDQRVLRRP